MVVVAIIAILMLVAVPSFRWIYNVGRLTTPANELVATLQTARMESIRRNTRTVVCRSDNPDAGATAACTAGGGAWGGWIAFVDNGDNGAGVINAANARNGVRDAGETLLRATTSAAPIEVRGSAAVGAEANTVVFRSDGLARATSTGNPMSAIFSVCIPDAAIGENSREVRLVAGSRISVSRFATAGVCAVPPNTR